jgi:hypothetical protein
MANRSRDFPVGRLALVAGAHLLLMAGCGGSSKLEFYSNEPGNFRVLVAGKPGQSSQTVASPAGQLSMTSIESVDGDQVRRVVVYTDIPLPTVQASEPSALLDGGIRGMSGKTQWTVQRQGAITLDGHPGREVRFAVNSPSSSEKGTGAARIFLVGNRLYQAIMVGPASKVNEEELDHFVKSFELLNKVSVPAIAAVAPPPRAAQEPDKIVVAAAAPAPAPAPEEPPALSADTAGASEPAAEPAAEPPTEATPTPAAPPARSARVASTTPDRMPPGRAGRVARSGQAPGRARAENRAEQVSNEGPDPSKPAEVSIEASGLAGAPIERPAPDGREQERFRVVAPERGVLVGMRVGYDNVRASKVASIQPIFQAGKNYIEGKRIGLNDPVSSVTVVGRPGYAVGAINTHAGLWLDSFQIVFMRFKDGQLDPEDSYTTDWLANSRGGSPGSASGEGKLVVGVHGRSNDRVVNSLGLLVAE